MALHPSTEPLSPVTESSAPAFELVQAIVRLLEPLSQEQQTHVLRTVLTWLRFPDLNERPNAIGSESTPEADEDDVGEYRFSERPEASPKEFMLEKDPRTDIERLACLAYYLTHFRGQAHFKTEDLSKLNTEAAQRKFSNAAFTAKNAMRDGFFVPAAKTGFRQLSAFGEQYVQALPDHDAARAVRKRMYSRRGRSANGTRKGSGESSQRAAV